MPCKKSNMEDYGKEFIEKHTGKTTASRKTIQEYHKKEKHMSHKGHGNIDRETYDYVNYDKLQKLMKHYGGLVFLFAVQHGQSLFFRTKTETIPYQRCLAHDALTPREKDNWKPSALYQADL